MPRIGWIQKTSKEVQKKAVCNSTIWWNSYSTDNESGHDLKTRRPVQNNIRGSIGMKNLSSPCKYSDDRRPTPESNIWKGQEDWV
jgi:hypothetical protein